MNELIFIGTLLSVTLSGLLMFLLWRFKQKQHAQDETLNRIRLDFEQNLPNTRINLQEENFQKLAREIHDNIGMSLTVARLNLRLSVEDRIRELSRKGMDEYAAYMDRQKQIDEKQAQARMELATGNFEVVPFTAAFGPKVKNIIILLGDGMGASQRTAARIIHGYAQGKALQPLAQLLVLETTPPEERPAALATWSMSMRKASWPCGLSISA